MNRELIRQLSAITEEEKEILKGKKETGDSRHLEKESLEEGLSRMPEGGRLVQIRLHTRFMHVPKHRHDYIEAIYMCQGQTIHKIDGYKMVLDEGELLFLNPYAEHEVFPAGERDLAVSFALLPQFFDIVVKSAIKEENKLRDFLIDCLCSVQKERNYLHFQVADVLPVQNLVENMVWTMFNNLPNKQMANQISMGLLFTHLMNCTERLNQSAQSFEQNLVFQVLRYIEANYRDGQLGQLCGMLGYDIYWLSRMIKRLTGQNYKDLLQIKRLNQAAYLLSHTRAAVSEISVAVGYDNTSYFHRIFREYYKMSPKEYRRELQASQRGNA